MVRGLYEKNPVRIDVVGSSESISKINTDLLCKCHRTFYNPSNMVLITVGNVDADKVMEAVDRELGRIGYDKEPKLMRKYPKERKSAYKDRVNYEMHVERPMFCIGFKDSDAPEDKVSRRRRQIVAEIVTGVLFSNSGELYNDLFKRGIMTTSFTFGEEYGKTYAFCYAGGECDDPDLVLDEIKKHLDKIKKYGLNKAAFDRRQKMTFASDIKIYDSTWDIANALFDNAFWGVDIFRDSATVGDITLDEANAFVKEALRNDRISFSVIYPYQN
jgi:predicted Zn-dependent peptidase